MPLKSKDKEYRPKNLKAPDSNSIRRSSRKRTLSDRAIESITPTLYGLDLNTNKGNVGNLESSDNLEASVSYSLRCSISFAENKENVVPELPTQPADESNATDNLLLNQKLKSLKKPKKTQKLTPLGLPKKTLSTNKNNFTLEEIYQNKDYKAPMPKALETIFENGHPKFHKILKQHRQYIIYDYEEEDALSHEGSPDAGSVAGSAYSSSSSSSTTSYTPSESDLPISNFSSPTNNTKQTATEPIKINTRTRKCRRKLILSPPHDRPHQTNIASYNNGPQSNISRLADQGPTKRLKLQASTSTLQDYIPIGTTLSVVPLGQKRHRALYFETDPAKRKKKVRKKVVKEMKGKGKGKK